LRPSLGRVREPAAIPDALLRGSHGRVELLCVGVTDGGLRGPLWTPSNRGLWAWSATDRSVARERILRAAPLVRGGGAIGGWAAALMHGHSDLDGVDPDGQELPVLLCLPRRSRSRRTRDVRVFRSDLDDDEVIDVAGVPVTSVVRTCADLARLTVPPVEAVVAVDVMARCSAELLDATGDWTTRHQGWAGVRRARRVLRLARAGALSPPESRLRMLWVLEAELPMPLVNPEIVDDDGCSRGVVDLLDVEAGLVGEYDGAHHATADQRSIDHARREQLQRAGLRVVQHTGRDLRGRRGSAVARLRQLYAEGLRRDRSLDRWRVVGGRALPHHPQSGHFSGNAPGESPEKCPL
jgi:hypothetical protein